jgi:hypothetical protein
MARPIRTNQRGNGDYFKMNGMRKIVIQYLIPLVLIELGTLVNIPLDLEILRYEDGKTRLYSDRLYVNSKPMPIEGYQVVLLPRHLRSDVHLESGGPVAVVRFLSDANENAAFEDWELLDWEVMVPGRSGSYTRAVRKEFAGPEFRLPHGGPASASPLLLEITGHVSAETASSHNKLIPKAAHMQWRRFIHLNAKQVVAMAAFYFLYVRVVARVLKRRGSA